MYATVEDMHTRFGQDALAALAPLDEGGLDATALAAALDDAAELVESHVAARYRVPLLPVPAPVRRWCADIAHYYLHRYEPPKAVRQAYEDAVAGLQAVARGSMTLPCAGVDAPPPPQGQSAVQAAGPERLFSTHTLKGF